MTREELQRLHGNIDELYEEYTHAEAERVRLKSTNQILRGINEDLRSEKDSLKSDNEALRADNESLREKIAGRPEPGQQTSQQQPRNVPALSPALREFLLIEDGANTGGIVAAFLRTLGANDRYKFYIGYLYERKGWRVLYDSGKRIICTGGGRILAVSTEAEMYVSHNTVYALIGVAMDYKKHYPEYRVSALCVTSKTLSTLAKRILHTFGGEAKENFPFKNFPYVKCKVHDDGRRIYYTPNDNDYAKTRIFPENGDMFRKTVDEASAEGFNPA